MAKKAEKGSNTGSDVATLDPFGRIGFPDWLERWPEFFGRRFPEGMRNNPFFGDACLMEQFTEDDGTLVLRAELPGLGEEDDVDVTVDEGRLTISGAREERSEHKDKDTYRSEFRYGSFERTIRLPAGARTDDISATYDEGILEVRVPVDADRTSATAVPIKNRG